MLLKIGTRLKTCAASGGLAIAIPLTIAVPLTIVIPMSVFAQEAENSETQLNPVIVKSKSELLKLNSPTILTERKTAKDIADKQVDDVHDIDRLDPAINYNSSSDSLISGGSTRTAY